MKMLQGLILTRIAQPAMHRLHGLPLAIVEQPVEILTRGVALRLPAAVATELHFSRDNVVPFQPGGIASTREWIQIDRADATEYEKDLPLFQESLQYVKAARSR